MEPAKQVLNKKNLVELFAGEKEKVNAFIRKNKVKTNNPESLKDLVSYYNSL
jgi:hypothetical protein